MSNIKSLSDGSGKNGFFTYVLDPNPTGKDVIQNDDLYCYVSLKAYPKSRSIIVDDTFNNSNNGAIDLITHKVFINGKKYLTTDYTNNGNNHTDNESLGLESINIKITASQIPTVTIRFIDAHGGALFNNKEYFDKDTVLNNSKYNVFFKQQPYTIFELTVKGYLGEPVVFNLNLTKISFSFDASMAAWVGTAEFIGYSYAFLSDIALKYVIALNNTTIGQSYLKEYQDDGRSLITIDNMLQNFTKITQIIDDFKVKDNDYKSLETLKKTKIELLGIQNILGNKTDLSKDSNIITEPFKIENVNFKTYCDFLIFEENSVDVKKYKEVIDNLDKIIVANPFLDEKIKEYPPLYKFNNINEKNKAENPLLLDYLGFFPKDLTNLIIQCHPHLVESDTIFTILKTEVDKLTPNRLAIANLFYYRRIISKVLQEVDELIKKNELKLVDSLNNTLSREIELTPTIYEIFRVLCGNVDIYLKIITDTAIKADSYSIERLSYLKKYYGEPNLTNIPINDNKIYPFPTVYNADGTMAWLGDIVGEDNEYYPEINLVNGILNSLSGKNKTFTYTKPVVSEDSSDWFKINVLDNNNTLRFHENYNFNEGISNDLLNELVDRFFIFYYYSQYKDFLTFSKLEALFLSDIMKNSLLKNIINNYNQDEFVNIFKEKIQNKQEYFINFINLKTVDIILEKKQTKYFNYTKNVKKITEQNNILLNLTKGLEGHFQFDGEAITKDLTNLYTDELISNRILTKYEKQYGKVNTSSLNKNNVFVDVFDDIRLIDSNISDFEYKVNQNNYLGVYFDNTYTNLNNFQRAYKYLTALPYETLDYFVNQIDKISAYNLVSKNWLALLGGQIYFNQVNTFLYSDKLIDFLKNYFINFVNNDFIGINKLEFHLLNYINKIKNKDFYQENSLIIYKDSINYLTSYFREYESVLIITPTILYKDNIIDTKFEKPSNSIIEQYAKTWLNNFKTNNIKTLKKEKNKVSTPTDDSSLKIVIYQNLQKLYESWLSYGKGDYKVYNYWSLNGEKSKKRLIDHFVFVDKNWSYIGDKAVLNPKILLQLFNKTNIDLHSFIGELLRDSKFNFQPVPTQVNYRDRNDVIRMFKPIKTLDNVQSGSCYMCIYVGGNSEVLEIDNYNYFNDSFNLDNASNLPYQFLDREIPKRYERGVLYDLTDKDLKGIKNQYNLAAFRVGFADQNQSIFKSVSVSQEEHKDTDESLTALSQLFDGKGAENKFFKGNDLYNVYLKRSYVASVSCLGNMQILPMMYFQLDNIPLFHGTYIIDSVEHSITANNVETSFRGRKVPKYTYPIVDKVTSYFNLNINDVNDLEQITNNNVKESIVTVNPTNGTSKISNVDFVKLVYPYAKKIEAKYGFSALATVTQAALESGWGRSGLAQYYNYFGVKSSERGVGVQMNTLEESVKLTTEFNSRLRSDVQPNPKFNQGRYIYYIKDWFRTYSNVEDGFEDRVKFFTKNSRYKSALLVKDDPNAFFNAIYKAGYATTLNYVTQLNSVLIQIKKIVKDNNL